MDKIKTLLNDNNVACVVSDGFTNGTYDMSQILKNSNRLISKEYEWYNPLAETKIYCWSEKQLYL